MTEDIKWRLFHGLFAFVSNCFPQEDARMQSLLPSVHNTHRGLIGKAVHFMCKISFLSLVLNVFCYLKDRNYLSLTLNSSSCTMKSLQFLPATLLKFQFFLWHYYSANTCSAFHKTYFFLYTLPSARCSPCTAKLPTTDAFVMLSLS